MEDLQTKHNEIKDIVSKFDGVHEVLEVAELPNKYDNNASHFTLRHKYMDKYNHSKFDFNIRWDDSVLFVRNVSYFPFTSFEELIKIIEENYNKVN